MKILKFEILKIVTNKFFFVTFLILWFLNILFLNYQSYLESKNSIPYDAYKLLELDLKGKTHEEKGKYINEVYEKVKAINIIYNIQNNMKSEDSTSREFAKILLAENRELYDKYYEESKKVVWKYTGNSAKELSFLEKIKSDYDIVNNYKDSINNILEESDNLKGISIFKSEDEVALRSINKTTSAYESMLNTKINYEVGKSVEKISSVGVTDFFILVLIFIISTIIITEEKEKNMFSIIKITKNGQRKTIIIKIVSLLVSTFIICLSFYGVNYLYYLINLGYGNLFSTIQSIEMFQLSILKVNVLEYLMILFFTKFLYMFLLVLLMFYLAIKFNNLSETLFILFIIFLINFLIYNEVDINSSINIFKSFNLVSLINTNGVFQVYDNLRFFNIVLSKSSTLLILQMFIVILLIILSIVKYLKSMEIVVSENLIFKKLKRVKLVNIKFNSLLYFEFYKLLFVNKGLIIIIIFIMFSIFSFRNQNFNLSYNESFYKDYMEILSGELTIEKEQLIQNTIKEYDNADNQLKIINEKLESGELSIFQAMLASEPYEDILSTRNVFAKIEKKYNYIKDNPDSSFVYDTGYNKLFRVYESVNYNDIYLLMITLIIISGLFVMEYKTGFISILNSIRNGRIKTARCKVLVILVVCTLIYIVTVSLEVASVFKMYGLNNMGMSIVSLDSFHNLSEGISIFSYFLMFYIVRYISYILIILVILYISLRLKNVVFTFVVSVFILFMPYILNLIGVYKSFIFPLMNLSLVGKNQFYFLCFPLIVIINIFLYNSVIRRLE